MYSSDEDSDSSYRTPKKRKRIHMRCNWKFLDPKNNEYCNITEYARGYCKKHFFQVYRRTELKKCLMCDKDADRFGDKFCEQCGIEMGTRPECKHEGCKKTIWSKKVKTEYCKEHDEMRKCYAKGCKRDATRDRFGFRYCVYHYPERKICKHVTKTKRCRAKWYSDIKDYGDHGFCYNHNISGIDRCSMNSETKKLRKYSGRCCKEIPLEEEKRCNENASHGDYCKKHSKLYNE